MHEPGAGGGERQLPESAVRDLREAKLRLENPGLAVRLTQLAGQPIEALLRRLPERAGAVVHTATRKALDAALDVALATLDPEPRRASSDWLHRGLAVAAGAAGGAMGLAGLALELPVSTTLMLRSIAEQARSQGEDIAAAEARLQCVAVFAMGGPSPSDDAAEAGYFAVRAALGRLVGEASEYVAARGLSGAAAERSAPAVVRFLAAVAQRFGVAVTEKAAAQLVPLVGAAGGAAINAAFMHHYQAVGWGHFTVRRLERTFGADAVRRAYAAL